MTPPNPTKGLREVILAQAALICIARPRVGLHSQVEDQVMVSLLRDAVVEPDCGRSQGSQLHELTLFPTQPSLPSSDSQHCNFSDAELKLGAGCCDKFR